RLVEPLGGGDAIDEAPPAGGRRVDRVPPKQPLHHALPRDAARGADRGRGGEDPHVGTRQSERGGGRHARRTPRTSEPAAHRPSRSATRGARGSGGGARFARESTRRRRSWRGRPSHAGSEECARISLRSWPAQNPFPAAARTTTCASGSPAAESRAWWSAA